MLVVGSILLIVPSSKLVVHTNPPPAAMCAGHWPTAIDAVTTLRLASMRWTVLRAQSRHPEAALAESHLSHIAEDLHRRHDLAGGRIELGQAVGVGHP